MPGPFFIFVDAKRPWAEHGRAFLWRGQASGVHARLRVPGKRLERRVRFFAGKPVDRRVEARSGKSAARAVDVAVDCPVEVHAWLMGLCGFLGELSCGMPRGAVIGGKRAQLLSLMIPLAS